MAGRLHPLFTSIADDGKKIASAGQRQIQIEALSAQSCGEALQRIGEIPRHLLKRLVIASTLYPLFRAGRLSVVLVVEDLPS